MSGEAGTASDPIQLSPSPTAPASTQTLTTATADPTLTVPKKRLPTNTAPSQVNLQSLCSYEAQNAYKNALAAYEQTQQTLTSAAAAGADSIYLATLQHQLTQLANNLRPLQLSAEHEMSNNKLLMEEAEVAMEEEKRLFRSLKRKQRGSTGPRKPKEPKPTSTEPRKRGRAAGYKRKEAIEAPVWDETVEDNNADICGVCGDKGLLICCEDCPMAYHLDCVGLSIVPKGEWRCKQCELNKKNKVIKRSSSVNGDANATNGTTTSASEGSTTAGGLVLAFDSYHEKFHSLLDESQVESVEIDGIPFLCYPEPVNSSTSKQQSDSAHSTPSSAASPTNHTANTSEAAASPSSPFPSQSAAAADSSNGDAAAHNSTSASEFPATAFLTSYHTTATPSYAMETTLPPTTHDDTNTKTTTPASAETTGLAAQPPLLPMEMS